MMNWAITLLVIALIAAVLGFTGIAGVAIEIAWIVFVIGMIMSIFHQEQQISPSLIRLQKSDWIIAAR